MSHRVGRQSTIARNAKEASVILSTAKTLLRPTRSHQQSQTPGDTPSRRNDCRSPGMAKKLCTGLGVLWAPR